MPESYACRQVCARRMTLSIDVLQIFRRNLKAGEMTTEYQYFIHSRQQYWPTDIVSPTLLKRSNFAQSLKLVDMARSSSKRSASQTLPWMAPSCPDRQARRICWCVHRPDCSLLLKQRAEAAFQLDAEVASRLMQMVERVRLIFVQPVG